MVRHQSLSSFIALTEGTNLIRIQKEDSVVSEFDLYQIIDNRESESTYGQIIGFLTNQYESSTSTNRREDVRVIGINHRQITCDLLDVNSIYLTWEEVTIGLLNMTPDNLELFTRNYSSDYYFVKFETKLGFVGYASPYSDDATAEWSVRLNGFPIPVSGPISKNVVDRVNETINNKSSMLLPIKCDHITSVELIQLTQPK